MNLICLSIKILALYIMKSEEQWMYEVTLQQFFIILIVVLSQNNFWKYQFKEGIW